jgi:hypothetical protein
MAVVLEQSDSDRKSIDLTVTASALGVTVVGSARLSDNEFRIPSVFVPCVYSDDASYRVALCRHASGPVLVLVEDELPRPNGTPPSAAPSGYGEVCDFIRWEFKAASDTCASVDIHVVRRVLVPMPTQYRDEPVYEMQMVPITRQVGTTTPGGAFIPTLGEDGEPLTEEVEVERQVQVGINTIEIPPEPLPEPTVHQVSAMPVLPQATAERTESRKVRRQIRTLRDDCRTMKAAGLTYTNMSAAQKAKVQELVALTGEPAPLAVP